jgi:RNA polymerase sigma-70 factor (ECF subfamily)
VEPRGVALPMPGFGLAADEPSRLLQSAKSGDTVAFEALLRIHEAQVARTAIRLLASRQDAQDAAQEVFLRLHRSLKQIDDSGNLPGWLYRVTVNVCRDMLRLRKSAGPLDQARLAVESSTEADLDRGRRLLLIEEAVRSLPEKERAALTLRDLEGLSTREVAGILGSTEATVRSQISAARLKIKKMLRRRM